MYAIKSLFSRNTTADQYLITLVLWNQSKRRSTDKNKMLLNFLGMQIKTTLSPRLYESVWKENMVSWKSDNRTFMQQFLILWIQHVLKCLLTVRMVLINAVKEWNNVSMPQSQPYVPLLNEFFSYKLGHAFSSWIQGSALTDPWGTCLPKI